MSDMIDHPKHYTKGSLEVIDIIKAIVETKEDTFQAYLVSNVVKYICRYEHKGSPVEDLRKAKWYLNRLIQECGKIERDLQKPGSKTIIDSDGHPWETLK